MKASRPKEEHVQLLREVVGKRSPHLMHLVEKAAREPLTKDERVELIQVVLSEFSETGLDSNDEPTERGRALDELSDLLNRE